MSTPDFVVIVDSAATANTVRATLKSYWPDARVRTFRDALDALDNLKSNPSHLVVTGFALTHSCTFTGPSLAKVVGSYGIPTVILDPTTQRTRPGPAGSLMIPPPEDHYNFDRLLYLAVTRLVPASHLNLPPQLHRSELHERSSEPELAEPIH